MLAAFRMEMAGRNSSPTRWALRIASDTRAGETPSEAATVRMLDLSQASASVTTHSGRYMGRTSPQPERANFIALCRFTGRPCLPGQHVNNLVRVRVEELLYAEDLRGLAPGESGANEADRKSVV